MMTNVKFNHETVTRMEDAVSYNKVRVIEYNITMDGEDITKKWYLGILDDETEDAIDDMIAALRSTQTLDVVPVGRLPHVKEE